MSKKQFQQTIKNLFYFKRILNKYRMVFKSYTLKLNPNFITTILLYNI